MLLVHARHEYQFVAWLCRVAPYIHAFRGKTFHHMKSRQVAEMGIARTFQNLALFKGMSVLDNIMTGRNLKMRCNLFQQALRIGKAEREEIARLLRERQG